MKKLIATAAASVLALATISAGEGLKVSGFIQGGLSADITDMVAADAGNEGGDNGTIGATYAEGDHWGDVTRGRLNVNYDGENGGIVFRFQHDLTDSTAFSMKNVKRAMAYANFFDGAVIVEGGKLFDRFTAGVDDNGDSFGGAMGVRLVVSPIENLYVTLQGSDYNYAKYAYDARYTDPASKDYSAKKARRNGNPKADANLLSISAAYSTDAFALAAGAHFSGIFYGSFAYTGIENLSLSAGFWADYRNWNEGAEIDGDDAKDAAHYTLLDAALEYDADPVLFGVVAYFYVADDRWHAADEDNIWHTVNPYVQYKLSDITALRVESTAYLSYDTDVVDNYLTITPSVVFNASEKANVNVWLQFSTDQDIKHNSTGVGVQYNF